MLAIIPVSRWAFGKELPAVAKLLAYRALAGSVTSHIIVVTGFTGELRKQHLLAKQT
ncbi:MAG: hypothetical protein RRE21_01555 [Desulfurococcales archaeon]|nr:hypothetical protein [Desulfurococcales archaeon]